MKKNDALVVTLAAAAFLMVTMGTRQSLGLFVSPLNTSTGLGIATISFALAIGQFAWGAIQPVAGAVADRHGPGKVLAAGLIGGFLGAWLGGIAFETSGNYQWMWYADMALAAAAALVNLPIREAPVRPVAATA